MITAEAAEAAGAQGKFWEMHDLIFQRQDAWTAKPVTDTVDVLVGYAKELGLDEATFRAALTNKTYEAKVKKQYDEAVAMGLPGTPSLIFNNIQYPLQQLGISDIAFAFFIDFIDYNVPPPEVIEKGKQYQATIKTEKGDIVIDLFADKTPVTVNNFVYLAKQGWYDNTIFHRVIPGFMAQGGDRTATGAGRPGYSCSDELNAALSFDGPGVVGMANSGPNTNGAQFFITLDGQPTLNGVHTVFGKCVAEGDIKVVLAIRQGDRIIKATLIEA